MKKVLNITMMQRILKPSLLAFLIAGSGFLPNASAVRWTIDFENKKGGGHIKASDIAVHVAILNTRSNYIENAPLVLDLKSVVQTQDLFEESKKNGVKYEQMNRSDPGGTIVLKNGILDVEESKKLLSGVKVPFNIEFIKCSGTLDLNEDLKEHAETIRFDKCDFKTVANCFKNAKLLQFIDTKITPEDGRLGILKPTKVQVGGTNTVLRPLKDVVIFERNEFFDTTLTPKNGRLGIDKTTTVGIDGNNKFFPYNMSLEIKRNNKDDAQYKSKITELEKEVKEKDRVIGNLNVKVQELKKEEANIRKELVNTIRNRNTEQEALFSLHEATQKQLEDAERNNKMYKTTIEEMKERNAQLKREKEKLLKNQKGTKNRMEDLEASKLKLEAINKKLEADNNALRKEINHQSERFRLAEETIEKNKKLEKENGRLKDAKEEANGEIKKLGKEIKTLKKRCENATEWANFNVSLIDNMKKRGTISSIKAFLSEANYWEKQREIQTKLEGKEDSKKLKTKKGKWIEFDPIVFINPKPSESEEEEEESEKESKDYFEIKTDNCEEDYFEEKDFQRQNGYSRGFGWNKRGRGYRGRGGYRGNYGRGSESRPMINRGRGGRY